MRTTTVIKHVKIVKDSGVNPPTMMVKEGKEHECMEEVEAEENGRIIKIYLEKSNVQECYVDRSRKYYNGTPQTEWVTVDGEGKVLKWEQNPGTRSLQEAELVSLTVAFKLGKGKSEYSYRQFICLWCST